MFLISGTARWYKSNDPLVPLHWVRLKDPEGEIESKALLCTDLEMDVLQIINFFIRRWAVEVTFEQVRAHFWVESQRQWSQKAIARTTPILMTAFNRVTLWANQLNNNDLIKVQISAWY